MEKTVLLIDDRTGAARSTAESLGRGGYKVTVCASAEAAMDAATRYSFDCVVYTYAGGNGGISLVEDLRERQPGARIFVYSSDDFLGAYEKRLAGANAEARPLSRMRDEIARTLM